MAYVIITPVKNEIEFIGDTMESVSAQTLLPLAWVIIDGGSTDGTIEEIQEFTKQHPWVKLLFQRNIEKSSNTTHLNVSLAVDEAYQFVKEHYTDYEYIWAIDGDQKLDPATCAGVIMNMDETTGAASGRAYNPDGTPDIYPCNELPNKRVYRREALEFAGGFPVTKYSYDTVVLAKIYRAGWMIRTYPAFGIQNLRTDSGIERNSWRSALQFGKARYYLGYSISLLILGCGYLALHGKIIKSLGVFAGYISSVINHDEKIQDRDIIQYFGKERINTVFVDVELIWATAIVVMLYIAIVMLVQFW